MFEIVRTKTFERDVKRYLAKGGSDTKLEAALAGLRAGGDLPPWFRDHQLHGKMHDCRGMHVEPDWLLVYKKDGKQLRIVCLWLVAHKKLRERERSA
ncbi:type II toxin-antitoxin system YafQ family toxin [Candidatus Peregrinibacteria bacterium]|nr:type II toxin-antitoxin system YafQ family toxin [Candidatus Peregrinibacteria bacterium]MBI3816327.1 type II toxin-antitoxin system YafQ family toxin [Candidatus Peregrinibacteria bacterium]